MLLNYIHKLLLSIVRDKINDYNLDYENIMLYWGLQFSPLASLLNNYKNIYTS